jgi:hypothetical protein
MHYRKEDCWAVGADVLFAVAIKNDRRIKVDYVESSLMSGEAPTVDCNTNPGGTECVPIDDEIKRRNRINGSVGGEFRVGDETWIRLGAFTDFTLEREATLIPPMDVDFEVKQLGQVLSFPFDRFGGTVGIGTKTGPVDSTIGVAFTYGQGDTFRFAPGQGDALQSGLPILDATQGRLFDLMFFLTGTVNFEGGAAERPASDQKAGG